MAPPFRAVFSCRKQRSDTGRKPGATEILKLDADPTRICARLLREGDRLVPITRDAVRQLRQTSYASPDFTGTAPAQATKHIAALARVAPVM